MDIFLGFITTGTLLGVLQFLLTHRIKARLENSIKYEYDKVLEEYKYEMKIKDRAAKAAEYLALSTTLKPESGEIDYRRSNQLSWELAMWLPSNIYKKMVQAVANPSQENNALEVAIEIRKLLLQEKAGNLTANDIAHHAPGIGKQKI